MHPDAEMLRLVATCYERMGNLVIPRNIYWQLAMDYPDLELDKRAEILHEAARFSAMLTDYSSAQYFGEIFIKPKCPRIIHCGTTFPPSCCNRFSRRDNTIPSSRFGEKVRERFEAGR